MSPKDKLTKEQIEQLQELTNEIIDEAKDVVEDYSKNPSDISGSQIHFHENSPYLAEREERLISFDGKKIKIKPDKA